MRFDLQPGDAALLVDVQKDFCPGGALAVAEGDRIVPILNELIDDATQAGVPIFASRDWHPIGHISFAERGGPWPTHCIQDTPGAEFHDDLDLPGNAVIISKGANLERDSYSAFDSTGLAERLRREEISRIWVGGLALDVCVRATVLDAVKEGFETHLIQSATRPVEQHPGDGERAVAEMRDAGAIIEEESAS
jgi:nicotinamidase/pyrazinamidase